MSFEGILSRLAARPVIVSQRPGAEAEGRLYDETRSKGAEQGEGVDPGGRDLRRINYFLLSEFSALGIIVMPVRSDRFLHGRIFSRTSHAEGAVLGSLPMTWH
jgi:hypothetical protein